MKNLFIPKDSEKFIEKLSELEKKIVEESENLLIFSADNKIQGVFSSSGLKDYENYTLDKREELIYDMAIWDNQLNVSQAFKVARFAENQIIITSCPIKTYCLQEYEGDLLFGGENGISHQLRNMFKRHEQITHAMEVHNQVLYDSGVYGVFITKLGAKISDRMYTALCSHGRTLYGGSFDGIYDVFKDQKIIDREEHVRALCVHNQELYDIGDYNKLYKTLTSETILAFSNYEIRNSMISVPKSTFLKDL